MAEIRDSQELVQVTYEPFPSVSNSQELIQVTYEPFPSINNSQELIQIVWLEVPAYVPIISGVDDGYTKALLHFNGLDDSVIFTDETEKIWTPTANTKIDTDLFKFGSASGLFGGSGNYISTPDHVDFDFGNDDFTVDFWLWVNSLANDTTLYNKRTDSSDMVHSKVELKKTTGVLSFSAQSVGGSGWDIANDTSFGTIMVGTWQHIAVARTGTSIKLFFEGINNATVTTSAILSTSVATFKVGADSDTNSLNGRIAEFRVSKAKGRWSDNFTPPGRAYEPPTNASRMMKKFIRISGRRFVN